MEFTVSQVSAELHEADVYVIPVHKGVQQLEGQAKALDEKSGHAISAYLKCGVFPAEVGTAVLLPLPVDSPGKWAVIAGAGELNSSHQTILSKMAGAAIRECIQARASKVVWIAEGLANLCDEAELGHSLTFGSMLGAYRFSEFKNDDPKPHDVASVHYLISQGRDAQRFSSGIDEAKVVADAVILTRDLANQPSNICTPSYMAQIATDICKQYGMQCEVHERDWIESQGMGLIAAVSRGATQEPKFVRMTYTHPDATKTIALAGKGVTFDSGGYSLKTHEKMYGMKDDMHGAAAVIAAMRAAAQSKAKLNVIGLLPLTENMIGPAAVHPGDIFKSFSGKNVEIANTDAEGRLLLADTVAYAESLGVDAIIDVATLTGACVIALGKGMSAVFGTDNHLVEALREAGKPSCEALWPLPLHADYEDFLKSDTADIKNTGGHEGGAITAALFIMSFVKKTPWAHIDLSGATTEKDTPLSRVGSTGAGAGTLAEYILRNG